MKRNKILVFFATLSLLGTLFSGCDDKLSGFYKAIKTESIELSQELSSGITLEVGESVDASYKVTLTPETATDRAENFSSSDPEIATVNGKGIVTANSVGSCDITITVGGQSASFTLTVIPVIEIPFDAIDISVDEKELKVGDTYDLAIVVNVSPLVGTSDNLIYATSDASIVTVSEAGIMEAIGVGVATITVSSRVTPTIKDDIKIIAYQDHDRTGWLLEASHTLPLNGPNNADQNFIYGALDDNTTTSFILTKPGKSFGGVSVPSGTDIFFIVDMGEVRDVNYFRILHRKITAEHHLRWMGFDDILASDDNVTFTSIATNVVVTDALVAVQLSPDIAIPDTRCRYLKFVGRSAVSMNMVMGNTIQLSEIYFGFKSTTP